MDVGKFVSSTDQFTDFGASGATERTRLYVLLSTIFAPFFLHLLHLLLTHDPRASISTLLPASYQQHLCRAASISITSGSVIP